MAELSRDRVRAAKLRGKRKLTPEQQRWLDEYEARTTMAKARKQRALPSGSSYTPTKPPERPAADSSEFRVMAGDAAVGARGGEPELGAPVEGVPVHETEHLTDVIQPEAFTWDPTVPPPPTDAPAEAPLPGVEAPPVGAPIVDEAPAAAGEPEAPPAAALAFAGIVTFITQMGLKSAIELAGDMPIPEALRGLADEAQGKVLAEVGAAAFRVGVKYGPKTALPYQDECTVAVALAGSLVCIFRAHKVKQLAKNEADQVEVVDEQPSHDSRPPIVTDAEVVAPTHSRPSRSPAELIRLTEG